jgi:maleylacetate reductase
MNFTHNSYAQLIRFGRGAVADVGSIMHQLYAQRVLLVTTRGRLDSPGGARVVQHLGELLVATFDGVRSHVPKTAVDEAVQLVLDEKIDAIVSFGGGSCSDLGKAVCYAAEQQRGAFGLTCFDRPELPHLAIPTAYSGAEVTFIFGVRDETARRKSGAGGPTIAPAAVIYDPDVTLDLPARVSAETGMNALAHCVEALWSPQRTPEAELIALGGARTIYGALPRVVQNPTDVQARTEMLAGAMLAGRCLQNASMGIHHGIAQMLGAVTGMPHGLANAFILAHAIRFNADAVPEAMANLATVFGCPQDQVAQSVDELRARLGLPARLREANVTEADIDTIVQLSPKNQVIARNPKPATADDVRAILLSVY